MPLSEASQRQRVGLPFEPCSDLHTRVSGEEDTGVPAIPRVGTAGWLDSQDLLPRVVPSTADLVPPHVLAYT